LQRTPDSCVVFGCAKLGFHPHAFSVTLTAGKDPIGDEHGDRRVHATRNTSPHDPSAPAGRTTPTNRIAAAAEQAPEQQKSDGPYMEYVLRPSDDEADTIRRKLTTLEGDRRIVYIHALQARKGKEPVPVKPGASKDPYGDGSYKNRLTVRKTMMSEEELKTFPERRESVGWRTSATSTSRPVLRIRRTATTFWRPCGTCART
jgi:hypothetical protein